MAKAKILQSNFATPLKYSHQSSEPQGAPWEGGGGRKMARIDNARLVCCCIELESRIYCEHLHAKTKPQGAPWEGGTGGRGGNGKN